ncbi:hypothetical protein SAMN06295974_3793 [Plantibacter flavus]|uniref:Uncharacterized protein n=1 Tax=Plantibacter flavus TaxID=150123 RepID=A0A3N2BLC3_9MICO|nr:hypothetical protein [Plantibacter flavus]ROR76059.1 hypothetical protein EDD42_4012 [Plantibacter flavus]SMG48949.1 hypothetical protein SAMN06295974_3793 [Plantibacter flavus]
MKDPETIVNDLIRTRYADSLDSDSLGRAAPTEPTIEYMLASVLSDGTSVESLLAAAAAHAQLDLRSEDESSTQSTLTLTGSERSMVLSALIDKELDERRYVSGAEVAKTPAATDSCCDEHLTRYRERRSSYLALRDRKRRVSDLVKLFTASLS